MAYDCPNSYYGDEFIPYERCENNCRSDFAACWAEYFEGAAGRQMVRHA